MRVRTTKRPPGLRFEAPAPALPEILPRMDIAAFVGFAARGPLHTPVVVEDVGAFASIFGDDLVLARDESRGEDAFAHLGPAVRSFFRNGGVRCWVVRVADENAARNDEFPLPGLVSVSGFLISV